MLDRSSFAAAYFGKGFTSNGAAQTMETLLHTGWKSMGVYVMLFSKIMGRGSIMG